MHATKMLSLRDWDRRDAPSTCSGARGTGAQTWRQPLHPLRIHPALAEDVGPAVTADGIVYAYDEGHGRACLKPAPAILAFRERDGHLLGQVMLPLRDPSPRLFLMAGQGAQDFLLPATSKPDC